MESLEIFKKRFLELADDLECKKSEVPKRLNIDYAIYSKIISFGIIPRPMILVRIADCFNVSADYLLGYIDTPDFYRSETRRTFYEVYSQLKEEKNYNDYAIARKLHVSTSYTTNWKKKNFTPSLPNLIILSQTFGVSLDYILGRTDEKNH